MASPITAADFDIQNFSGDVCERLRKLLELNSTLFAWFTWAFNESGNPTSAFLASLSSIGVAIGAVIWYPKNQVPVGYIICNGQAINRTTYAPLFAAIGTQYGAGDGSTTFNVPDLQRKYLIGADGSLTVGQVLGNETITVANGNLPYHTHHGGAYYRATAGNATELPADPSGLGDDTLHSNSGHTTDTVQTWHTAGVLTTKMNGAVSGDTTSSPISILPPSMAGLYLIKT
jgi:microcystin-dependent protein